MPPNPCGLGRVKKWKSRIYCLHGSCMSNTQDPVPDVLMIPFAKPCIDLVRNFVNPVGFPHNPKQCNQCSKVLRWIHLCKRGDKQFTIYHISRKSFICSKHFYFASGPSEECPDPFPANKSEAEIAKIRLAIEKRLTSRASIEQKKKDAAALTDPLGDDPPIVTEATTSDFEQVIVKKESVKTDKSRLYDGTLSRENIANMLFEHNFPIRNTSEAIQVTIQKGVHVDIQPTLDININVYGTTIPIEHELWTKVTKKLGANSNMISIITYLDSLQEWRVCSVFEQAQIASQFITEFGGSISECDKAATVLDLASTCRIFSRMVTCNNCKQHMTALRKIQAKQEKERSKCQKVLPTTNTRSMDRELREQSIQRLERELSLERCRVARLCKLSGLQAVDLESTFEFKEPHEGFGTNCGSIKEDFLNCDVDIVS